jgi:hypothetical protein
MKTRALNYAKTERILFLLNFCGIKAHKILARTINSYVCSLFNNALSNAGYKASAHWTISKTRIRKECAGKRPWPHLKYYPSICLDTRRLRNSTKNRSQDNWCHGQDSNRKLPAQKSELSPLGPTSSANTRKAYQWFRYEYGSSVPQWFHRDDRSSISKRGRNCSFSMGRGRTSEESPKMNLRLILRGSASRGVSHAQRLHIRLMVILLQ